MTTFPFRRAHRMSSAETALTETLLSGGEAPADAPAGYALLSVALAAAAAAPAAAELSTEQQIRTAFRQVGRAGSAFQPRSRKKDFMISELLSAKLAAAIAAGAVGLGGAAAAAYAGALPTGLQNFAHDVIGAPGAAGSGHGPGSGTVTSTDSAQPTDQPSATPSATGPSIGGPATYGLCTAYLAAQSHGSASATSVPFAALVKAAGGTANVATYCANFPRPGSSDHPTGRPTGLPSQAASQASDHPTGRPTSLPSQATSHDSGTAPQATDHPSGARS